MSTPVLTLPTPAHEQFVDVAQQPGVARWLKELARRDSEGFLRLAGPNRQRLEARWGTPRWTDRGPTWTAGWLVLEDALRLLVLTGPHSTQVHVHTPHEPAAYLADPRVGLGLTQFLQRLLTDLKT